MSNILSLLTAKNLAMLFGFLFTLDQFLASIPAIEANSTFQLIQNMVSTIYGFLKKLAGGSDSTTPPAPPSS